MSFVLIWQPSDCTDLFVIDYIFVLFSENKYDDEQSCELTLKFFKRYEARRTCVSRYMARSVIHKSVRVCVRKKLAMLSGTTR